MQNPQLEPTVLTLRDLRTQAGLTYAQVSAHLASHGVIRDISFIGKFERKGIREHGVIKALAELYQLDTETVYKAALNSASDDAPRPGSRGRKKMH